MSQGPYPPGYDPADDAPPPARRPGEGYPDAPPTGRASARVPQPEWPAPQRPESGAPSSYPTPHYAGPESPQDPHAQFRRPQPYGEQPPYGGPPGGGYGGQGGGTYGTPQGGTYGSPAGGFGGPPPERGPGGYGGGTYPPQPGQYDPGQPGQYDPGQPGQYDPGRPSQYGDPTQQPYGDSEGGPYSALRYDQAGPGGPPPQQKSRRGLIISVVVAAVAVLALAAVGVTYFMSSKGGSNFAVDSCVRKSGDKAESVSCSTSGSYKIVSKVGSPSQCPDQAQPYVVLQEKGKGDQVLCLKPAK